LRGAIVRPFAAGYEESGRRRLGSREGGRVPDVNNVIWCTGFHGGFSWIDLPIFEEDGEPRHEGGVVHEAPGLYFVGLHFLYSFSSVMVYGVGRDAERIAKAAASRASAAARTVETRAPALLPAH
jgi:putative flavoprotein involved in K+ transport